MARRPITNPIEYLQMARRRWLWIVVPLVLIAGITAVIARRLPKEYKSTSLILVEPQKVPADFVKPTVSGDVALRLESIEEQILSRTQLTQLIQKYALYQGHHYSEDQQVTAMLGDVTVLPVMDPAHPERPTMTAFRISYTNPDPNIAQQVTRELANEFINENLKSRANQAQGTETFIDGELQQSSQALQTLQTQLKNLKDSYMGSLPEQQQANLSVLAQLQAEQQENSDALARAQQQKTYLNSLTSALASLAPPAAANLPSPLELQLSQSQTELSTAERLYTPAHPDVVRLKAQVAALTQQVDEQKAADAKAAKAAAAAKPADAPQVQGQIAVIDQEIKQRTQDQKTVQAKIAALNQRIERLPEVEEKLSNLQNAYDVAKADYTTLLEKKQAANMGTAMEQQGGGEEFRIMDPANLPQKPTSPNQLQIDLMGALGGLALGLALAWILDIRDSAVRSEADVLFYTQVPMLAIVPQLSGGIVRALPAGERKG